MPKATVRLCPRSGTRTLMPPQATVRSGKRLVRRPPVLLMAQTQCETCGEEILDPLQLEELGRYCSARCFHARGLPRLFRRGA